MAPRRMVVGCVYLCSIDLMLFRLYLSVHMLHGAAHHIRSASIRIPYLFSHDLCKVWCTHLISRPPRRTVSRESLALLSAASHLPAANARHPPRHHLTFAPLHGTVATQTQRQQTSDIILRHIRRSPKPPIRRFRVVQRFTRSQSQCSACCCLCTTETHITCG